MATTPDGIWVPTKGTNYTPIEGWVGVLAASVQTALNNRFGDAPPRAYRGLLVNNAAERNAAFASGAQQGDAVFRNDLGYEEWYYTTAYASVAGWYPAPGTDITTLVTRGSDGTWSGTNRQVNLVAQAVSLPSGRYKLTGNPYITGDAAGAGTAYITQNSQTIISGPLDVLVGGLRNSLSLTGFFNWAGGTCTIGLDVDNNAGGNKTISGASSLILEYVGPRH